MFQRKSISAPAKTQKNRKKNFKFFFLLLVERPQPTMNTLARLTAEVTHSAPADR